MGKYISIIVLVALLVISSKNTEVINKTFEERTQVYYDQLQENSGDRTKKHYTNIRLNKIDDAHYELVADLSGMYRLSKEEIDSWINTIKEKNLTEYEIPLLDGGKFVIYTQIPDPERIDQAYYSDDWKAAKEGEWIDENGFPMFMDLIKDDYASPVYLRKEDDGYIYPRYRSIAGVVIDTFEVTTINAKDAIKIELYPDDIISLDYEDFYGTYDNLVPVEKTVEAYYNSSPSFEGELRIDANDMSEGGFEIEDGKIHVIACYYGI